jgi:hypothetical protein
MVSEASRLQRNISNDPVMAFCGIHPLQVIEEEYFECNIGSRDIVVGIATDYGLDDGGVRVRVPVGARICLSSMSSRPALGPSQPPIQWVQGAFHRG